MQAKYAQFKNRGIDENGTVEFNSELDYGLRQFGLFIDKMSYLQNLWISNNENLMSDIKIPQFISEIVVLKDTYLSYSSKE